MHLRAPLSNPRFLSFRGTPGSFPREIPHTNSLSLYPRAETTPPRPNLSLGSPRFFESSVESLNSLALVSPSATPGSVVTSQIG